MALAQVRESGQRHIDLYTNWQESASMHAHVHTHARTYVCTRAHSLHVHTYRYWRHHGRHHGRHHHRPRRCSHACDRHALSCNENNLCVCVCYTQHAHTSVCLHTRPIQAGMPLVGVTYASALVHLQHSLDHPTWVPASVGEHTWVSTTPMPPFAPHGLCAHKRTHACTPPLPLS